MATSNCPRIRRGIGAAIGALAAMAWAGAAPGVIVSGGVSMPKPVNGYVGWWNGSSGVAVGEYWVMSAKHVGGWIGQVFIMDGIGYHCVEMLEHPTYDIMLVRLDRPLPGWHRLGTDAKSGDPVLLGGYGLTTAGPLAGNAGWDWAGDQVEAWGANVLGGDGNLLTVGFDPPSSGVPYEATYAVHDSGAGLFTVAADGKLELQGIAVSVTGWGDSRWGNAGFCLNVDLVRNWAMPIIAPSTPVTSGVIAPRSSIVIPGLPEAFGGVMVVSTLATLRRRRDYSSTRSSRAY